MTKKNYETTFNVFARQEVCPNYIWEESIEFFGKLFFCTISTIQWQENIAFNYSECFLFCKLSLYECKFKCQPRKWEDFFPVGFLSATDIQVQNEIENLKVGIPHYVSPMFNFCLCKWMK